MYFNHAFRKSFLPVPVTGAIPIAAAGTSASLTAGRIGFFDAKTWAAVSVGTAAPFVLAQGSYFTKDKITPALGGYQESLKSKVINPKYITRLIKNTACSPVNEQQTICVCDLKCDTTYRLRIDLKGSPALRFLSHNLYRVLDAYTGCCSDTCSATCENAVVDPTIVTILWAKQIVQNPIVTNFLSVVVKDWNGVEVANQADFDTVEEFVADLDAYSSTTSGWDAAYLANPTAAAADQSCLVLNVAYYETKFGYCTFTPTDFYELQPLHIIASVVDETGNPCNVQCVTITETVTAVQASGVGETVLRDLILSGRYVQNAYPDSSRVESLRMREIEADPALVTVDRNALYDQVMILHSVPRFYNPTGTFDNDQYLLVLHVPTCTDTTAITDFIMDAATAAGNNDLVFEKYGCTCPTTTTTTTAHPTTTTTTTAAPAP